MRNYRENRLNAECLYMRRPASNMRVRVRKYVQLLSFWHDAGLYDRYSRIGERVRVFGKDRWLKHGRIVRYEDGYFVVQCDDGEIRRIKCV